MESQQLLNKVIEFYSDPKHLPGVSDNGKHCRYYVNDTTKCAIGCLFSNEDAAFLQSMVDKFNGRMYLGQPIRITRVDDLIDFAWNVNSTFYNHPDLIRLRSILLSVFPEDLTFSMGVNLLYSIQTSHDAVARAKNDNFLEDFKKDLKSKLSLLFSNLEVN